MAEDVAEVRVGRSNVKYGGIDLGFTEGEITLSFTQEHREFRPDQSTLKLKDFLLNESVEITVPLAQSLAKSLARAKAFAAGTLKAEPVGGGGAGLLTVAAVPGATTLTLDTGEGATFDIGDFILVGSGPSAQLSKVLSIASETLTLEPTEPMQFAQAIGATVTQVDATKTRLAVGDSRDPIPDAVLDIIPIDGSDPIRVYKARVISDIEMPFQKAEESVYEVTYTGRGDTSRARGDRLFSIGDQSVT